MQGPVLQSFLFDELTPKAPGQHRGISIGAAAGTPVLAPVDATITFAGTVAAGGKTLSLLTAQGLSVTLLHLGSFRVGAGRDRGPKGQQVGTVVPSGSSEITVPFVYLGVRRVEDPQGYLDPLALSAAAWLRRRPSGRRRAARTGARAPPAGARHAAAGGGAPGPRRVPRRSPRRARATPVRPGRPPCVGSCLVKASPSPDGWARALSTRPAATRASATARPSARGACSLTPASRHASRGHCSGRSRGRPGESGVAAARPGLQHRSRRRAVEPEQWSAARVGWTSWPATLGDVALLLLIARRGRGRAARIIGSDALLPDDTDLLREREPAYRARVHDDRGGRARPAPPAAR